MQNKKNYLLKLNTNSKSANEKHTLDLDVPKLNPCDENEEQSHKSLINPEPFAQGLEP